LDVIVTIIIDQNSIHRFSIIPEVGGHTNFRNAGVHVKPTTGGAVLFSYIDPDKRITDKGFTEHSGCPVHHGEKKIVTQWIRMGVDKDNPWDSFNSRKYKEPNNLRCIHYYDDICAAVRTNFQSNTSTHTNHFNLFIVWTVGLKYSELEDEN